MALLNKVLNIPIRQEEVDFVIPDIHVDRKLGIDPFLLYRSPNPVFREAHDRIIRYFGSVIDLVRRDQLRQAEQMLLFPEPNEIGLGYTEKGIAGNGVGPDLARELVQLLRESPALLQRGIGHVEELQLICPNIGADRVSDIAANILKDFLVEYTREQCKSWNIPIEKGLPVHHYFDFKSWEWRDGYFDLPKNPATGAPLIFVPRRILRILPWINYGEYLEQYKSFFLRGTKRKDNLRLGPTKDKTDVRSDDIEKAQVCEVTRQNTASMNTYVERKEREASNAEPFDILSDKDASILSEQGRRLEGELAAIQSGREDAYEYQDVVHRALTFCFHPHLVDGKPQERTVDGTLIRDLIFCNEGTRNFWRYIQQTYGSLLTVFELKNKNVVEGRDIDQLTMYLGDPMGRFGILVSRGKPGKQSFQRRKTIYNKEHPRKVIIHLSDEDLINLLRLRASNRDTTAYVQDLYRAFITSIE